MACCPNRPVAGRGVLTVARASADVRNVRVWATSHGALRTAHPTSKRMEDLGNTHPMAVQKPDSVFQC